MKAHSLILVGTLALVCTPTIAQEKGSLLEAIEAIVDSQGQRLVADEQVREVLRKREVDLDLAGLEPSEALRALIALAPRSLELEQGEGWVAVREARALHRLGVVDIGVLFQRYQRKDELEQAINRLREEMKDRLEQRQVEIKRARADLESLPPGAERERRTDELKLSMQRLEMDEKRMQRDLKRRVEENTLTILTELEEAVREYARQESFDLILKVDRQGALGTEFQERIFRAQIGDVLFHADRFDVTQQVSERLNRPAEPRLPRERR